MNKMITRFAAPILSAMALFTLASTGFADDRGEPGGPFGPPPVQELLRSCASSGYRYSSCDMGGPVIDAQLAHQDSHAACTKDRTWGISGNTIWVDKGCRASFNVLVSLMPIPVVVLECSSGGMRYNECPVGGPILSLQLEHKISASACVLGRSFGSAGDRIWVDHGCRATFRVVVGDRVVIGGGGRE